MESEISLQRLQMKHKNETELLEDSFALPGFHSFQSKVGSSEDEFVDSDDVAVGRPYTRPSMVQSMPFTDSKMVAVSTGSVRRDFKRRQTPYGWLQKLDPNEPVLLFTKPLDPEKLAAAGIKPPTDSSMANGILGRSLNLRGRIGRGGRLVFDRWNPLMHTPIECGDTLYLPPKPRPSTHR
nr:Enhancer of polycomb like [Ipomoea batatas]